MPDVYEQAAIFRRELDALDRKAARQMQESYRDAYRVMQARLQAMTNLIEAKKAAGEPVEGRWLFQQERWRQFYSSLRDEIEAYGKIARGITVDAQGKAIEMGQAHTAGLIKSALGKDPHEPIGFAFNKPADKVLRQMVGFAANGLPLSERWGPIAEEARALALKTMQRGVLIGQNPYVLAREMQGPLGVPLWRSMTIARTETLRAYRESQRQTVLANTDILEGWVWHSAKDPRTCEVCWAMDGKLFPIGGGPDTAGHVMASGPAPSPIPTPPKAQRARAQDAAARWSAEEQATINRGIADYLDNSSLRIRVESGALRDILQKDYKTQLETGYSTGTYDPESRKAAEERLFGIGENAHPSERPVYGYFSNRHDPVHDVEGYGDVVLRLRDEVKRRSTFTAGDTLDAEGVLPVRVTDAAREGHLAFEQSKYRDPQLLALARQGAKGQWSNEYSYIEGQVFGGVTRKDIDYIAFTGAKPDEAMVEYLNANGIRYSWTGKPNQYGEFEGGDEFAFDDAP